MGMITFNPVKSISFSPSFEARRGEKYQKPKITQVPPKDTFERTIAGVKTSKVIKDGSAYGQKYRHAMQLHQNAQRPRDLFDFILEDIFGKITCAEGSQNRPIKLIKTQVKSVSSIHEKMASKGITSQKNAMKDIDDIVRGRIIYNHGKKRDGNAVADALIDAINHERINIVEIIHNRPNDLKERSLLEYITSEKMREVEDALEKKGKTFVSNHKESRCGYLADHIIIKIPGTNFKAEIQLMGENVEAFKEIEDICYKMKCGKKVPDVPKKLQDSFAALAQNENLIHEFNRYTKAAYRVQRLKDAGSKMVEGMVEEFLPLSKDYPNLHSVFDFNNIAKILRKAKSKD